MAEYLIQDTTLTAIGDSIRAKTGGTALLAPTDMPTAIDNIPTGGGASEVESGVIFIDYDGTIVASWESADVASKTALPDNPSHDRLVAQGWNWTLTQIQDYIEDYPGAIVVVGQMYKTVSGLTEFDITLTKVTGLTVTCKMVGNKDWGDGTEDNLTSHTYADYGDYMITCDGTSIPNTIFGQSGVVGNYWCRGIFLGENVTSISGYAIYYCYSLTSITIPNGVASIGEHAFNSCFSLTSVTLPNGVKNIDGSTVSNCYTLTSIAIPYGVTSIGNYTINYCHSLTSITIPYGVTSIGSYMLGYSYSLTKITFPQNVTSIANDAFYNCHDVSAYDFSAATVVPTLATSTVFRGINGICKIVVPDALYYNWVGATNWSTYADYIYNTSGKQPQLIKRYASSVKETSSGTTLTTNIQCNAGDMVVVTFAIRGNTYTIPSDWTLLGMSDVVGSANQRTGMAYKFAANTTESITITQDSSARIYTNLVALQGATGITFNGFVTQETGNAITVNRPSGLVVWGVSSSLWGTTSPYLLWGISNTEDIAAIQLGTSAQSRCLTALDQSSDETVSFTYSPDTTGDAGLACGSCMITGIPNFWYYEEE